MALTAYPLTIETVGLDGQDLPEVTVQVELQDPELARAGMPPETIVPLPIDGIQTDAQGVLIVNLLPSSIVGNYLITLGGSYPRVVQMPAQAARLSDLNEAT